MLTLVLPPAVSSTSSFLYQLTLLFLLRGHPTQCAATYRTNTLVDPQVNRLRKATFDTFRYDYHSSLSDTDAFIKFCVPCDLVLFNTPGETC